MGMAGEHFVLEAEDGRPRPEGNERRHSGLWWMADDNEPLDPVGNEPSPLLFFAAGIIPLLLVGGWFLFR